MSVNVARLKQEAEETFIGRAGEALYQDLEPHLKGLPEGSYVVIAVETGAYTTGKKLTEAISVFEQAHGDVPAYVRRIGRLPHA